MNLLEVGALLKKERERRGISIRDVMDATKISRRNLTALEEGQVKSLPHPVYLKGYVRNIAKMVGLDDDELAQVVDQQYDAELGKYLPQAALAVAAAPVPAAALGNDAPADAGQAPPVSASRPEQPAPPPAQQRHAPERETRPHHHTPEPLVPPKPKPYGTLRSVLALVLLVGALIGLLVQYQRMQSETPPAPAPVAAPEANATNATDQDNATNATDQDNATAAPVLPEPAAAPATSASPAGLAAPEPPRTSAPGAPSAPISSIEVSRKSPAAQALTVPAPAAPAPAPQAASAPPSKPGVQVLTITAKGREVCWVGVFEGAKRTTFILRDGESRQVEFAKRATVSLGNAGGVTVRLNGRDYPFEGERGQKATLEFGTR